MEQKDLIRSYISTVVRKNSKSFFSFWEIIKIKNPKGKKHMPKSQEKKFGLNE